MRRYLTLAVVLVFAVLTAVLVHHGNLPPAAAGAGTAADQKAGTGAGTADGSKASGGEQSTDQDGSPERVASNVPMTRLNAGQRAPQFIIFSFDGVGDHGKWGEFLAAAAPTDARFTGFLTGTYLLADANAERYAGPGHRPGKSSVGFGGTADEIATRITDLNRAYAAGHEIGTHYNGHFCSGAEPSGQSWSAADWTDELDSFFALWKNYQRNNPGADLGRLTVPADSVRGGRTPCLEGVWENLVPAWKKHGFTYDTSMNAPTSGISWPEKTDGIWEFAMPYVWSAGLGKMVVNMDYNLWVSFNGGADEPGTAPALREKVYRTYTSLYEATYQGNRAPLLIANHFNNWNGNSFNPATLKFMKNYCGKPETYCATYSDVVAWLENQDPAVLEALQLQPPVADTAPGS